MLTQPNLIPMPFANSGDANTIPETNTSPSTTSAASWTSGFPVINSTPLAAGGIPPAREDFNGAFKALSEHTMWEQSGNPYEWSEDLDYVTNARAQGSDGKMYVAKQNSGPNTDDGPKDPTTDDTDDYWILEEDLYGAKRNPGELVYSMLSIKDASLHLVDGTVLSGSGMYADFVSYVAGLIENQPNSSNVYKVGNLADVDNVLSGFTTSSYAKLPFAFSPGSSPWEMVFKVTTGGDVTTSQCLIGSNKGVESIGVFLKNSKLEFLLSSNNTSFDFDRTGVQTFVTNTVYFIRVKFTGTTYIVEYSTDGTSYISDISVSSTLYANGGNKIYLGIDTDSASDLLNSPFLGSIDLAASYININSSRWWSGTHKAGFMDETEWQETVSKYKACGCFVYDDVANTLRLPKVTGFLEGTVDPSALGTLVEAGLPGISGATGGQSFNDNVPVSGPFYRTSTTHEEAYSGSTHPHDVYFNAALSSPIYGNSTTVQPQAIKGFVYMVVANRTKTQIVADIDEIAADLQLKADVDLGNVTAPGNVRMAHAAMPSGQYIDLTLPASGGTVTAPADGWILHVGHTTDMNTLSRVALELYYSSSNTYGLASICYCRGNGADQIRTFLPVSKGDIVYVVYNSLNTSRAHYLQFFYANGSIA